MQKHMVTCPECGRRFDANWGAAYLKESRRYMCPRCVKKHNAAVRERKTGMRQSKGWMWVKIVFGVLFVLAGFTKPEGGWTVGYFLTALVVGGALIAWGLVPSLRAKKEKKAADAEVARRVAETAERIANTVSVCPACGARTKGSVCEYCGTPL